MCGVFSELFCCGSQENKNELFAHLLRCVFSYLISRFLQDEPGVLVSKTTTENRIKKGGRKKEKIWKKAAFAATCILHIRV